MTETQFAWVIETGGNPLLYWTGRKVDSWAPDHAEAVRFARFEDAERVRCWLVPNGTLMARSVEHVWCAAAARPPGAEP